MPDAPLLTTHGDTGKNGLRLFPPPVMELLTMIHGVRKIKTGSQIVASMYTALQICYVDSTIRRPTRSVVEAVQFTTVIVTI